MNDRNGSATRNGPVSAIGGRQGRFATDGGVVAIVAAVAALGVSVVTIGMMILNALEQIDVRLENVGTAVLELQADMSAFNAAMRDPRCVVRDFDRRVGRVEGRGGFMGPLADSEGDAALSP